MQKSVLTTAVEVDKSHEVIVPRHCTLSGFTDAIAGLDGLHVAALEPLTRLEMRTKNSLYEITVVEPSHWRILVRGGRFFPTETVAYLCGSGYGGTLLKVAWIGLGLCCELSTEGLRVVTSPVERFHIVEKALPGPF